MEFERQRVLTQSTSLDSLKTSDKLKKRNTIDNLINKHTSFKRLNLDQIDKNLKLDVYKTSSTKFLDDMDQNPDQMTEQLNEAVGTRYFYGGNHTGDDEDPLEKGMHVITQNPALEGYPLLNQHARAGACPGTTTTGTTTFIIVLVILTVLFAIFAGMLFNSRA
uniref:Uncharacterized protein n=1 Tax=viral metagenome TaxID=1070528 RepID=A0A6C0CLB4_9ZZZZ